MDTYSYFPAMLEPGLDPQGSHDQGASFSSSSSMQRNVSLDTSMSCNTFDSGYGSLPSGMYEDGRESNEYSPYNLDDGTFLPDDQSQHDAGLDNQANPGSLPGQEAQAYNQEESYSNQDDQLHGTSDYILTSTGQWTEQNTPKSAMSLALETPLQLFARIINDIDRTSNRMIEQAFEHRPASIYWITKDRIQAELARLQIARGRGSSEPSVETTREAIQNVLFQHLWRTFSSSTLADTSENCHGALVEAAYQLQKELNKAGADGVSKICVCAVGMVLTHLQRQLQAADPAWTQSSISHPTAKDAVAPEGDKSFCCDVCSRPFRRPADLLRHREMLHKAQKDKKPLFCDYKKCARHQNPFYRLDHLREHLRLYHKEDLVPRGGKGDAGFWESRAPKALFHGWYRCNRCLDRVSIADHAFVCPNCQTQLEPERQAARGY